MVQLTSRKVAIIAVFSGLYYALSILPAIKFGATGASVSVNIEAFLASIFGLVLGPFLGALTAFSGALLAWALPPGTPSPTSLIFLPAPVINAFVVGLIYTRRWKIALITLGAVIAAFWFLPPATPWDLHSDIGLMVMWDKILALLLVFPAAYLLARSPSVQKEIPETAPDTEKAKKVGFSTIMPIVASFLILVNTLLVDIAGNRLRYELVLSDTTGPIDQLIGSIVMKFGFKDVIRAVAPYNELWYLLGVAIIVCALLIYLKPKRQMLWNTLIFIFSCLSVVVGGGFIIGLFIGVLSSVFAILKKRFALPKMVSVAVLAFFLLAFIGNEADNALGADIFALPMIYNGLFGYSTEAVRASFRLGVFLFPAIRAFQAIITTLIAVPLMRNLTAAGLSATSHKNED